MAGPERAVARRPERGRRRFLSRSADEAAATARQGERGRAPCHVGARRDRPTGGCDLPARRRERRARPHRGTEARRQGGARTVKALITGGEGGLGRAMRARLEREGYEVESLDLLTGFDVTDPAAWERVQAVDLAVLNAGILTADTDLTKLSNEDYRRAVAVN